MIKNKKVKLLNLLFLPHACFCHCIGERGIAVARWKRGKYTFLLLWVSLKNVQKFVIRIINRLELICLRLKNKYSYKYPRTSLGFLFPLILNKLNTVLPEESSNFANIVFNSLIIYLILFFSFFNILKDFAIIYLIIKYKDRTKLEERWPIFLKYKSLLDYIFIKYEKLSLIYILLEVVIFIFFLLMLIILSTFYLKDILFK